MKPTSTISVVVPCHNYGRFLGDAIASIDAQTRAADEVIVVDDGSSDETPEVIADVVARRPDTVVVARAPARGAARTFNDGVRASSGDLVMILSADDRMSPRYLELLEGALADPSVAFAYCEARMFGAQTGAVEAPPFDPDRLMRHNYINGSALLRRSLFDDLDGWRPDIPWEDWEFWVRAVGRGHRGVPVDGCWLDYRRHANGSRDTMSPADALRAHVRIWWLNRTVMGLDDVAAWMGRSVRRRAARVTGSRP